MLNNLKPHLKFDFPEEQIAGDWRILRAHGENLHCEFPTLSP